MIIQQIFISSGHNYFGHAGRPPDDFLLQEVEKIECVAGHGIRGDRFYDHKDDYHGQITFFSRETFDALQMRFPDVDKSAGVLRRNVIVSGVDLNSLVGSEFELQGVRFLGTDHCRPCYWLDTAFAPGTKHALEGNGGLRARILTDGWLAIGPAELVVAQRELAL